MSRIYVGNLPFQSSEQAVTELFSEYGQVDEVAIITDRETGRSRGFCFVEMPDSDAAEQAIESLNGQEFEGRTLVVNEARPRENRQSGSRDRW